MEVYSNVPFDILVANLTNITVHVLKHMILRSCNESMVNNLDTEEFNKDRGHTVATSLAISNHCF